MLAEKCVEDVKLVCEVNGIEDETKIEDIRVSHIMEFSDKEFETLKQLVDISKHYVPIYCEDMEYKEQQDFFEVVHSIEEKFKEVDARQG